MRPSSTQQAPKKGEVDPAHLAALTAANRGVFFSLAQPFTAGNRPIELQARFIGLPIMLKLKRESKPDESGSNALSAAPQP